MPLPKGSVVTHPGSCWARVETHYWRGSSVVMPPEPTRQRRFATDPFLLPRSPQHVLRVRSLVRQALQTSRDSTCLRRRRHAIPPPLPVRLKSPRSQCHVREVLDTLTKQRVESVGGG